MLFQNNIPDPHVGFYSKNVLGDDAINGEVSDALGGYVSDSWFYGYYLNGPSNGSPQTQGYLNNVSETFIKFDDVNAGSSPKDGWFFCLSTQEIDYLYFSISPFAFNDTKKSLWVYIENIQSWFLFDRYYCIKDYRLGLDDTDFETFTTSYTYYWMRQVLAYDENVVSGMTAGEGILSYANVYSGKELGFVLLKPHGTNNLRAYYGNNSSINPIDLW